MRRLFLPKVIAILTFFICAVAINVCAASEMSIVSITNQNGDYVTGVFNAGETITVALYAENPMSVQSSVAFCAIYSGGQLRYTYLGSALDNNTRMAYVSFVVPDLSDGRQYYMKCFIWDTQTFSPICNVLTYDISGALNAEAAVYTVGGTNKSGYLLPEIFENASFEENNLITGAWNVRGTAYIERSADIYADGAYSCKIYNRANGYSGIQQGLTEKFQKYKSGYYIINIKCNYAGETLNNAKFFGHFVIVDTEGESEISSVYGISKINAWGDNMSTGNVVYMDIPQCLDSAYFCFETAGVDKDDIYVDSFSLRRFICNENMNEYFALNVTDNEQYSPSFYGTAGCNVYYPQASNEVLINPYKGLVYYQTAIEYSEKNIKNSAADACGIVYSRYAWSELEPTEGNYEWDKIEANIELCKMNNKMLAIGIGSNITINEDSFKRATPEWVFDSGAQYVTQTVLGEQVKLPVYTDSVFMEKYTAFIRSFAQRFNGNTNIAYVDMRSYGNWGEWNFSLVKALSDDLTFEQIKPLVDVWGCIDLPLMMFGKRVDAKNYAYNKFNAGSRVDGTMHPMYLYKNERLAAVDGRAPSVAEWHFQPYEYYEGGSYNCMYEYLPIFYERTVTEGKTSYMALGYWDPVDFYGRFSDVSNRLANLTGYWFKPVKISYPENISGGTFEMMIKNDGVTQLYCENPCVKLALADENGIIAETFTLKDVNPSDWKAGKYVYISQNYAFNGSGSKLLMGVFSNAENEIPDIKLGIKGTVVNGWYDLTDSTNEKAQMLSENRLYTAKTKYADLGYGFRRPEHAFDGDSSTYWANECVSGNFLKIDFGEAVAVSDVLLKSVQNVNVPFSIDGYCGGKWVTLGTGSSVLTTGTTISFATATVTKLRFSITQNSDNIIRLSEFNAYCR